MIHNVAAQILEGLKQRVKIDSTPPFYFNVILHLYTADITEEINLKDWTLAFSSMY